MFAAHKSAFLQPSFALTFIGSATNSTDQTTYDFGNFTTSAAGVVVAMFTSRGSSSRSVSSVSIGGEAATLLTASESVNTNSAAGYIVKSSGTHNVSVTLSGSRGGTNPSAVVSVYLVSGYNSATPVSTSAPGQGTSGSASITLNTTSGGAAIYAAVINATTMTWSSATEATSELINTRLHESAYISPTATVTGLVETATFGSSNQYNMVGLSFR
jgi:hypothetical protein